MNRRVLFVSVMSVGLVASAGCRPDGGGLRVRAPARLLSAATSTDAALCERLAVDLSIREVGATGAVLDAEPLTMERTCEWALTGNDVELTPGNYRLLARFIATDYVGQSDCSGNDVADVWVGAYWVEEVAFPFPADFDGLGDDVFFSRPTDNGTLADATARMDLSPPNFDPDGDALDNLVEVAAGSNPCRPGALPAVQTGVDPTLGDEGTPFAITVTTTAEDNLAHAVRLRLSHNNGAANAPEALAIRLRSDMPEASIVPEAVLPQLWTVDVAVLDAQAGDPGSASWQVTVVPDEPFVGELTLRAYTSPTEEDVPFPGAPPDLTLNVTDLPDPVQLFVADDNDELTPIDTLRFAEVGAVAEPTVLRLMAQSGDVDGEVDGTFILANAPEEMLLGEDLGFTTLSWAPTNDDVVASFDSPWTADLTFVVGGVARTQTFPVVVDPLFNNAPQWAALDTVDTNIPPPPFVEKELRFDIRDPDRFDGGVDAAPQCNVMVWPEGDAPGPDCAGPCCGAWSMLNCAAVGPLDGDVWHMVATLTAASDYSTLCGDEPSFEVALEVSDAPPPGAVPATSQTISTQATCGVQEAPTCAEYIVLRTADITSASVVGGWPGVLEGAGFDLRVGLIDPATGIGLFGVALAPAPMMASEGRTAIVNLNNPPTVERVFSVEEFEFFTDVLLGDSNAVLDPVNQRVVGYGRAAGEWVVAEISLVPPFDIQLTPLDDVCPACSTAEACGQHPVFEASGDVYLPCGNSGSGELVRVGADGTKLLVDLGDAIDGSAATVGAMVITDEMGAPWLVWPDELGIAVVELATFEDVTPNVLRIDPPPFYRVKDVEGYGVAPDGRLGLLAFDHFLEDGNSLVGIRVSAGTAFMDGPMGFETANSSGYHFHRFVFRQPSASAPPEWADVVITGHGTTNTKIMVDFDTFAEVPFPRPLSDYQGISLRDVYESPDPRFFAGVVDHNNAKGLVLYPWDPQQPPILQVHGLPAFFEGSTIQNNVAVSHPQQMLVLNKLKEMIIFRFLQVP